MNYNNPFFEFFKPITEDIVPGILPYYQISNYGNIYSSYSNRYLSNKVGTDGYMHVNLRTVNGDHTELVHRLVLRVFDPIENPSLFQVNHKDGNKLNNFIGNLEWCTRSENIIHGFENGLLHRGEDHPNAVLSDEQVHFICKGLEENKSYREIITEMQSIYTNLPDNIYKIISKIRNGKVKKHISCNYTFTKFENKIFTDEQVHFICKSLQENKTYKEILNELGYDLEILSDKEISSLTTVISTIKQRKGYTTISSQYVF